MPKGQAFRTAAGARPAPCADSLRGYAFQVEELVLIADWARHNDHQAVVCIDHGLPGEEYEEAVMLRFGTARRCRFILWRSPQAIVVQPLIGRAQEYRTIHDALAGALLNQARRPID